MKVFSALVLTVSVISVPLATTALSAAAGAKATLLGESEANAEFVAQRPLTETSRGVASQNSLSSADSEDLPQRVQLNSVLPGELAKEMKEELQAASMKVDGEVERARGKVSRMLEDARQHAAERDRKILENVLVRKRRIGEVVDEPEVTSRRRLDLSPRGSE